jgi:diguanylate cyclase (GGDEF)-like protein
MKATPILFDAVEMERNIQNLLGIISVQGMKLQKTGEELYNKRTALSHLQSLVLRLPHEMQDAIRLLSQKDEEIEALRAENDRLRAQREDLQMKYLEMSIENETDGLTGAMNQKGLYSLAARLDADPNKAHDRCIVYTDFDGFKRVNDVHGHEAGNELLIAYVHKLKGIIRSTDRIYRCGGDEFVIVFNGVEEKDWDAVRENLVLQLENGLSTTTPKGVARVGVSVSAPSAFNGKADIHSADQSMYAVKTKRKAELTLVTQ